MDSQSMIDFILCIFAVYWLTSVLTISDGAWGILYKLREVAEVKSFGVFNCFLCLAIWATAIVCIVWWLLPIGVLFIMAISGAATVLHRITE